MSAAAIAKSNRDIVLSTYRGLLRATRIAFQDDLATLQSSRHFAREGFKQNRKHTPGSVEAEQAVQHAQGVAQILRENVVQGATDSPDANPFKLRIHEHTERGDNESVKQFKGTGKSFASVKCCSS